MTNEKVFDLIEYFKVQYNYEFINIEDLLLQPFIQYEGTGANALFWININNTKYLFKCVNPNENCWLGELLSKEFADILGIPCAEYQLCKLGNQYGILSKKFTKENEAIVLGAHIIQETLDKYPYLKNNTLMDDQKFLELYNIPNSILNFENRTKLKYVYNNLNNLEQLWSILDIYLNIKKISKDKLKEIMDYLLKTFMFDLITMNADRHIENWGIVENQITEEIRIAELFDNSTSFGVWDPQLDKRISNFYFLLDNYKRLNTTKTENHFISFLYKDRLLLTPSEDAIKNAKARKRQTNLELLDYFLKISDNSSIELFVSYIDKIRNTSISNILEKIEKNQNIIIDNNIKSYLNDSIHYNLYYLDQKIKLFQMQQGRGKNE